ncbi:unnamed protein product [Sphagnum jensenii]
MISPLLAATVALLTALSFHFNWEAKTKKHIAWLVFTMSLLPLVVQVALFILEAWHSGFGFFRCLGNKIATYIFGDYMAQLAIFDWVRRGRTFPPTLESYRNDSLLKNFSKYALGELIARFAMPFTYNDPFSNKLQFMGRAKVLYFGSQARTGIHVESQDPNQMPESGLVTRELYDKIDFDDVQTRGYYKSTKIREVTFVVDYIARQRIEVTYNVGAICGYASLDYSRYRLAMVIGMVSELSDGAFIVDLHELPNQQNRWDGLRLLEDLEHEWQQDNPRLQCMTLPEIMEKIKQDITLTLHPKIFHNTWF